MLKFIHCSIIARSKYWKQTKCPYIEEELDELWYFHTREDYVAVKRMNVLLTDIAGFQGYM